MEEFHLFNLQGHWYMFTSYLTEQCGFAAWLIVPCPVLPYFILGAPEPNWLMLKET